MDSFQNQPVIAGNLIVIFTILSSLFGYIIHIQSRANRVGSLFSLATKAYCSHYSAQSDGAYY